MASRAEAKYTLTAKDKSGPAFKSFGNSLRKAAKGIGRMGGAALGAGVAGFAVMARQALESADRVHKLNQQLGASTELLSELRGIASLSGTTMEALSKGIGKMSKNIGAAKQGLKTQKDAFEALGISMRLLDSLSVDQKFELLGSSLAAIKDESLQAKLGMDIFGGAYKGVLNVFADGLSGFRAMREEQKKMGRSLSVDQVRAAAAANDAMDRLMQTLKGVVEVVTLEFAPGFTAWVNDLKTHIVPVVRTIAEVVKRVVNLVGATMATFGNLFSGNFAEAGRTAAAGLSDLFASGGGGSNNEVTELLRGMAADTRATRNALAGR